MDGRQSLSNALITLVVVAILALVASVFKMRSGGGLLGEFPEVPAQALVEDPTPVVVEEPAPAQTLVREDLPGLSDSGSYQVLMNCVLIEDARNSGSSIRVHDGDREFVVHLYYAKAPLAGGSVPEVGALSATALPELEGNALYAAADDARDFALAFLRDQTFKVFTRWERADAEDHVYGFVVVRAGDRGFFLSELLVANGYGSIMEKAVPLPDGTTPAGEYLQRLRSLAQVARRAARGLWVHDATPESDLEVAPAPS